MCPAPIFSTKAYIFIVVQYWYGKRPIVKRENWNSTFREGTSQAEIAQTLESLGRLVISLRVVLLKKQNEKILHRTE